MDNRWEDTRYNRLDDMYHRHIKESEDFFKNKNMGEEPPVKRGLGIDFKAVLKMLRIFAKELRRKKDGLGN